MLDAYAGGGTIGGTKGLYELFNGLVDISDLRDFIVNVSQIYNLADDSTDYTFDDANLLLSDNDYTTLSWGVLYNQLLLSLSTMNSATSLVSVEDSLSFMKSAYENRVYIKNLKDIIETARSIDPELWSTQSIQDLYDTIDQCEGSGVYIAGDNTDVADWLTQVQQAISNLTVDKTELENYLSNIILWANDRTPDSFLALMDTVTEGQKNLDTPIRDDNNDVIYTQKDINNALDNIKEAQSNLVYRKAPRELAYAAVAISLLLLLVTSVFIGAAVIISRNARRRDSEK